MSSDDFDAPMGLGFWFRAALLVAVVIFLSWMIVRLALG